MSFIIHLVLVLIFYFIGLFVTSFTVIQSLIIIFFGIPITNKLNEEGVLRKNNNIIKGYLISLLIFFSVFVVVTLGIVLFAPQYSIMGYFVGVGSTLLFGLGQIGGNKNNISDYYEVNKRHFKTEVEIEKENKGRKEAMEYLKNRKGMTHYLIEKEDGKKQGIWVKEDKKE
jgi:hypothetical protein